MAEKVFKSPYPKNIPTDYYKPIELASNFPKTDIFKSGFNATGTTTTIYTVPAGKVFVLEYFYIAYAGGATDAPRADQLLYAGNEVLVFVQSPHSGHAEGPIADHLGITLSRGIKFPAGTAFKIDAGTSEITTSAGIYGYETDPENIKY